MAEPGNPIEREAAQRVLTVLERYGREVRGLAADPYADDLYRSSSDRMDEIRRCCVAAGHLSVPFTALLISHAEFVHHLWRVASRRSAGDPVAQLRRHTAHIDALAEACYELLAPPACAH